MPKFSVNKKTVTIKLRTGIRFNDGTPFNAAAVKQSIERHKTMPRSMRASELAPVASVDAQGNNTVVLHLNNRYAPLTSQLADRAGMVMSPKALNELGDKFATNPVCVGPFMFKERVVGDHITLVRSPYYRDKNKVHLDQIVIRIINDPAARAASLRSHDIDVAPIASTELQSVTHDPSLRVIKSVSLGYQGISINIGNKSGIGKPYENVGTTLAKSADLRQAFELALDRNLINRVVFGGVNKPSCSPFPDQNPYAVAAKAVPCHLTARVAAAKAAFGRSGAKSPVDVRMLIGTTTIATRLGALIQSLEKPVGFNVIPEPTESATGLSRAAAGKFDTFALGWSGRVDPDANLHQFVNSKGSSNYSGYMNPRRRPGDQPGALDPQSEAKDPAVSRRARATIEGRTVDLLVQPDQPRRRLEKRCRCAGLRRRTYPRGVRRIQEVGPSGRVAPQASCDDARRHCHAPGWLFCRR